MTSLQISMLTGQTHNLSMHELKEHGEGNVQYYAVRNKDAKLDTYFIFRRQTNGTWFYNNFTLTFYDNIMFIIENQYESFYGGDESSFIRSLSYSIGKTYRTTKAHRRKMRRMLFTHAKAISHLTIDGEAKFDRSLDYLLTPRNHESDLFAISCSTYIPVSMYKLYIHREGTMQRVKYHKEYTHDIEIDSRNPMWHVRTNVINEILKNREV